MSRFSNSVLACALSTYMVICCPSLSAIASGSKADSQQEDEQVIRAQADAYAKAFAAGDAGAIANFWTEDGTYTDSNGTEHKGRADIEKLFQTYFKENGAKPITITVTSVRFPAKGVAVEEGSTTVVEGSRPFTEKYTVVHQKVKGTWHMMAVSETNCEQPNTESIKDLEWLAGSWSATGRGYAMHFKAAWDAGHHFLALSMDNSGVPFECVAWNPVARQIISWHFDFEGGFGNGSFTRYGDTWTEHAVGVQPDGNMSRANYIIKKISDNQFSWRSIDRTVNGLAMPDTQEVVITRDGTDAK